MDSFRAGRGVVVEGVRKKGTFRFTALVLFLFDLSSRFSVSVMGGKSTQQRCFLCMHPSPSPLSTSAWSFFHKTTVAFISRRPQRLNLKEKDLQSYTFYEKSEGCVLAILGFPGSDATHATAPRPKPPHRRNYGLSPCDRYPVLLHCQLSLH